MAELFPPTWLYGPGGQSVLCEEYAHYDAMLAAGFKDSPAHFGIETHPAKPVQQLQLPVGAEPPAAPHAPAVPDARVTVLYDEVKAMSQYLESHSGDVGRLAERVAAFEAEVHERLAALDASLTSLHHHKPGQAPAGPQKR
jgi:hypothetical protein